MEEHGCEYAQTIEKILKFAADYWYKTKHPLVLILCSWLELCNKGQIRRENKEKCIDMNTSGIHEKNSGMNNSKRWLRIQIYRVYSAKNNTFLGKWQNKGKRP